MLDRFLTKTLGQQLGRHVYMAIIFTDGANKTRVSLVKLSALALSNRQVVPDARVVWGEFRSPLQVFDCRFKIVRLKQQVTVVVQILRVVFVSTHRSLKRLEGAIVHALASVGNTQEVLD